MEKKSFELTSSIAGLQKKKIEISVSIQQIYSFESKPARNCLQTS